MKTKGDSTPVKIKLPFDEAMRRAVRVPPMPLKKKAKTKKKK